MTTDEHLSTETTDGTVNTEQAVQQKKPDPGMKFLFQFYIILSIPVIFFIMVYFIWLFASKVDISFKHGGVPEEPEARVWAQNKISTLLTNNSYGCITGHKDSHDGLTIEVAEVWWKSLSGVKQKAFIRDIARARKILGFPNHLTVIDSVSKAAYGTYSTPHGVWVPE